MSLVSISLLPSTDPPTLCAMLHLQEVPGTIYNWTVLVWVHPLTFRDGDAQSNIIGLRVDLDIFNLNNPQDVLCI